MNLSEFNLINEAFFSEKVSPGQLDFLLAEGWRHFGSYFFRYNVGMLEESLRFVTPLRIRVSEFQPSKSQKRVLRKNSDLTVETGVAKIDKAKQELFAKHATRFKSSQPESIFSFLDIDAGTVPCETLEFCVYDEGHLIAVSFLDIGKESASSVYAMFDPEYSKRSLGIFTMILEIKHCVESGKRLFYQGYAYEGESFYDYKKKFSATEIYDWDGGWAKQA